jgi:hypothetical protein
MTEQLMKTIVDCATGEVKSVPLTAAEIAQRDQDAAAYAVQKAAEEEAAAEKAALKESAKAKLIAGEPLTAEEAAVLVI